MAFCADAKSVYAATTAIATRIPAGKSLLTHVPYLSEMLDIHVLSLLVWIDTRAWSYMVSPWEQLQEMPYISSCLVSLRYLTKIVWQSKARAHPAYVVHLPPALETSTCSHFCSRGPASHMLPLFAPSPFPPNSMHGSGAAPLAEAS